MKRLSLFTIISAWGCLGMLVGVLFCFAPSASLLWGLSLFLGCFMFGEMYQVALQEPNTSLARGIFGADAFKYRGLIPLRHRSVTAQNLPMIVMSFCGVTQLLFASGAFNPHMYSNGLLSKLLWFVFVSSLVLLVFSATLAVAFTKGKERAGLFFLMLFYLCLLCPVGGDKSTTSLGWMLTMGIKRPRLDQIAKNAERGVLPKVPTRIGFQHFDQAHMEPGRVLVLEEAHTDRMLVHVPKGVKFHPSDTYGYLGNGWWLSWRVRGFMDEFD